MLFSCENDMEKISKIQVPEDSPNEVIENLTMIFTDSGRVKVRLEGTYVEKFSGENSLTIFSDGLKLTFLDKQGNPMSVLTAEYGEIRPRQDRMVARHNVVFQNKDQGKSLKTEELIWDQKVMWNGKPGKVFTDKPVAFETKDGILYGEALETNESFQNPIITTSNGVIYYSDSTKNNISDTTKTQSNE